MIEIKNCTGCKSGSSYSPFFDFEIIERFCDLFFLLGTNLEKGDDGSSDDKNQEYQKNPQDDDPVAPCCHNWSV